MRGLKIVKEGKTDFFIPSCIELKGKGPGKKDKFSFYNPAMEENRDISVIVVQALVDSFNRNIEVLDGLASVGARGLRIAREVNGDFRVVLNDWNKEAVDIAKKSIEYNNLSNVETSCEDVNVLLCRKRFHYIDVDPFGSPVPYISVAVRALFPDGILAVTATDTATLCGVYPKTCLRRYGALSLRTWCMHEIGLRILLGYIIREGASFDMALYPLLSYSRNYYMRVYLRAKRGAKRVDDLLKKVDKTKIHDFRFKEREIGPLWLGDLHDGEFLVNLNKILDKKDLGCKKGVKELLERCGDEVGMPPFFYDVDALSSYFKRSPPKISRLMNVLEDKGYRTSRTHFRSTAFKTDAPFDEVLKAFSDLTI